jgi:hypothetical protein
MYVLSGPVRVSSGPGARGLTHTTHSEPARSGMSAQEGSVNCSATSADHPAARADRRRRPGLSYLRWHDRCGRAAGAAYRDGHVPGAA